MRRRVGVNERGRPVGQDHWNAKLTDRECELIRSLHEEGYGYGWLAEKFGVAKSTIQDIVTYRRRGQWSVRVRVSRRQ